MLTRPARDVDPEVVVEAVERGMRTRGAQRVLAVVAVVLGLPRAPSVGLEIKNRLKDENVTLSLPSQRIDRFDDSVARTSSAAPERPAAFARGGDAAPPGHRQQGLANDELLRGVQTAYDRGWRNVKLYFMIGLPGETDADVLGIAETVEWLIKTVAGNVARKRDELTLTLTLSNFTPKPHTPFQWHSVSTDEFERRGTLLKAALKNVRNVKSNWTSIRISAMEDFIGRGDRALCVVIRRLLGSARTRTRGGTVRTRRSAPSTAPSPSAGLDWKYRQVVSGEWDVLEKLGDKDYGAQGGARQGARGPRRARGRAS